MIKVPCHTAHILVDPCISPMNISLLGLTIGVHGWGHEGPRAARDLRERRGSTSIPGACGRAGPVQTMQLSAASFHDFERRTWTTYSTPRPPSILDGEQRSAASVVTATALSPPPTAVFPRKRLGERMPAMAGGRRPAADAGEG